MKTRPNTYAAAFLVTLAVAGCNDTPAAPSRPPVVTPRPPVVTPRPPVAPRVRVRTAPELVPIQLSGVTSYFLRVKVRSVGGPLGRVDVGARQQINNFGRRAWRELRPQDPVLSQAFGGDGLIDVRFWTVPIVSISGVGVVAYNVFDVSVWDAVTKARLNCDGCASHHVF